MTWALLAERLTAVPAESTSDTAEQSTELTGSGSGEDMVPVVLNEQTREIWLVMEGEPISSLETTPG